MKINTAILVDNLKLSVWQKKTLDEIEDLINIRIILNCENNNPKKKYFKNFFYYFLNYFSIKNNQTQKNSFNIKNTKIISFKTNLKGKYQIIPKEVIQDLNNKKIKIILKFGMNIIKIDPNYNFAVLSYHHGNPEYYRGRPAGFYEILNNEKYIGAVVQKISNDLDFGDILIKHKFKINTGSYKKTLENIYLNSPIMMRKAIINLSQKNKLRIANKGKLYFLPSNITVLKFVIILFTKKIINLVKIIFFQKKWQISISSDFYKKIDNLSNDISSISLKKINFNLKKYSFISDPFFSISNNNLLRFEAYNKRKNLGEIIELDLKSNKTKRIFYDEHYSYPISLLYKNEEYIFPETAFHSQPFLYKINSNKKIFLKGFENLRIVDATIFLHNKIFYLFYGLPDSSLNSLYLSYSENLFGPYLQHPMNPIVVDPTCARMGGNIIAENKTIYRLGQDNSENYGDGLNLYKIIKLNQNEYTEEFVNNIKFKNVYGPHTIDFIKNTIAIDHYKNQFNLFTIINKFKNYKKFRKLVSK